MLTYDILIIGSGVAGLYATLEYRMEQSLLAEVLAKVHPTRSHTGAVQGGTCNAAHPVQTGHTSWGASKCPALEKITINCTA